MLTTRLLVSQSYAGAEMDLFLSSLEQTIPAIKESSTFSKTEEESNGQDWSVFEWVANKPQALDGLPFTLTKNTDGTYQFSYPVGPIQGFSDETESDSIMMVISLTLPRAVDFANTMDVEDATVTWNLRKSDLAKGVILRAITK